MKQKILSAALVGVTLTCSAAQAGVQHYELMFGGYSEKPVYRTENWVRPQSPRQMNTSQKGLRELEAGLFKRDRLERQHGCLAAALYFEARGEDRMGQIAVGQVILNRVRARAYPDTICKVVWQNAHRMNACQFSFTCDGKPDRPKNRELWDDIKILAAEMLSLPTATRYPMGKPPQTNLDHRTRWATHYHATYVTPGWSNKLERTRKIGRHVFYISGRIMKTMPQEL